MINLKLNSLMILICGLLLVSGGCRTRHNFPKYQPMNKPIKELIQQVEERDQEEEEQEQKPTVTARIIEQPLSSVINTIARQTNCTIIASQDLQSIPVTLDLNAQPIDKVILALSRFLGCEQIKHGDLYILGELRSEDLAVMVRRVRRLDQQSLEQAIKAVITESGRVFAAADGVVIVTDKTEVLQRVDAVIDGLENSTLVSWVVQLYVIQVSEKDVRDLGLDVTPAASVAYSLAAATSGNSVTLGQVEASFDAMIRAEDMRHSNRLMAEPLFSLSDGESASFVRGDTIPVPQRTISDQGTVSVTGYQEIQTGVTVDVSVREQSRELVRLEVDLQLNDVVELINGESPRTSGEQYSCKSLLRAGRVALIGSLERRRKKQTHSQWFKAGITDERETNTIQIWARAYRVDMGQKRAPEERRSDEEASVLPNIGINL